MPSNDGTAEHCLRILHPNGTSGVLDDFLFSGAGSEVQWSDDEDTDPDSGWPLIADHFDAERNVWVLRELTPAESQARYDRIIAAASGGGDATNG